MCLIKNSGFLRVLLASCFTASALLLSCDKKDAPAPNPPGIDPSVTGFSPTTGETDTDVNITGAFPDGSTIVVKFGSASATVKSRSTVQLTVTVPAIALSGLITVTIDGVDFQTATPFSVKPKISTLSTGIGFVGTSVMVTGSGFDPASLVVKFNTVTAVATSITPTSFSTTVPAGATSGEISATVDNLVGTQSFSVITSAALQVGGNQSDSGVTVGMDGAGNIYLVGSFGNQITVGATVLTSSGSTDIFIVKYNSNLDVQWAIKAGGTSGDGISSARVDNGGNVYIAGGTRTGATFGSFTASSASPDANAFIAKINTSGTFEWLKDVGGNAAAGFSLDNATALNLDNSGNVVVGGYFSGAMTFGSLPAITATGDADMFVAVLATSDGSASLAKNFGDNAATVGVNDLAVDGSGNIFLAGLFNGTFPLGGTTLTATNVGGYITKLNSSAVPQWVVEIDGGLGQDCRGIDLDGAGRVYVTGRFSTGSVLAGTALTADGIPVDTYAARLSAAGSLDWVVTGGSPYNDYGMTISVQDDGTAFVSGIMKNTFKMGSLTISSIPLNTSNEDIFIARIDSDGTPKWIMRAGGQANDLPASIAILGNSLLLAGTFVQTATFGETSLTSPNHDAFLWKVVFQ